MASARSPAERFGLGLYVCRQIVELHDGAIEVSSPTGGGSCGSVTIPTSGGTLNPSAG